MPTLIGLIAEALLDADGPLTESVRTDLERLRAVEGDGIAPRELFLAVDSALRQLAPAALRISGDAALVNDAIANLPRVGRATAPYVCMVLTDLHIQSEIVNLMVSALKSAIWADAATAIAGGEDHPLRDLLLRATHATAFSSPLDLMHDEAAASALGCALALAAKDDRLLASVGGIVVSLGGPATST